MEYVHSMHVGQMSKAKLSIMNPRAILLFAINLLSVGQT